MAETAAITLETLLVDVLVGIREREQRTPQPLSIDLTMHVPTLSIAGTTGDLSLSVNYAATAKQAAFIAAHGQWGLLESLAHALCGLIILPPADHEARAPCTAAEVVIHKPKALKGLAVPVVRMRRAATATDRGSPTLSRDVFAGVTLDILAETSLGAAYRLRLAPHASWPLPAMLAAHVVAGSAKARSGGDGEASSLKPDDVLPRGAGVTLCAGAQGAALLLVGPQSLAVAAAAAAYGGAAASGLSVVRPAADVGAAAPAATAYIALGSNLGHRARHLAAALGRLRATCGAVTNVSQLYVTAPQHIADQPDYHNAACELRTRLPPAALLEALKEIERSLGREMGGVRYGPRVVDLDIAMYGDLALTIDATADGPLTVPHELMLSRTFVLAPLCDVCPHVAHPTSGRTIAREYSELCRRELQADPATRLPQRVLPVREDVTWPLGGKTYVMAILNLTPDSFSDGGRQLDADVEKALAAASALVAAGADVLDLGAESTRPGAQRVSELDEHRRLIPVVEAIRHGRGAAAGWGPKVVLSVDTTRAAIARAAVAAGADIINDISGGAFDAQMVPTACELGVPLVLMHTRGTPQTMQSLASYDGDAPTAAVCAELTSRVQAAHASGLPPWWLVADPGIGFAKTPGHSMALLRELPRFVRALTGRGELLPPTSPRGKPLAPGTLDARSSTLPRTAVDVAFDGGVGVGGDCCATLVGASRKGFIGKVLSQPDPLKRQWGNAATVCAAVVAGADIVRVHEVGEMRQVALLADAVHRGEALLAPPASKL